MTTHFVSRHAGAPDWAVREGIEVDLAVDDLKPSRLRPVDTVIGTLPVHLAAEVCRAGARLLYLAMEIRTPWRGRELSAEKMAACGARLQAFSVVAVDAAPPGDAPTPRREGDRP